VVSGRSIAEAAAGLKTVEQALSNWVKMHSTGTLKPVREKIGGKTERIEMSCS
jgi:hypothetical protein